MSTKVKRIRMTMITILTNMKMKKLTSMKVLPMSYPSDVKHRFDVSFLLFYEQMTKVLKMNMMTILTIMTNILPMMNILKMNTNRMKRLKRQTIMKTTMKIQMMKTKQNTSLSAAAEPKRPHK